MRLEFIFGSNETKIVENSRAVQLFLKSDNRGRKKKWIVVHDVHVREKTSQKLIFENDEIIGGIFLSSNSRKLADKGRAIYNEIFEISKNHNLCRMWNFIPRINNIRDGEEIYRTFNRGRSAAFSAHFPDPKARMPAATGIDILGEKIVVAFIATKNEVTHFSNPLQMDAFNYPKKYGVRPPSFARATKTRIDGKQVFFVSGTASIRGHETVHVDDAFKQTDVTVENIFKLLKISRLYTKVTTHEQFFTEKVVYIRDEKNFAAIKKYLVDTYPLFADSIFLHANVCRKDLAIEISLTAYEK